MPFVVNAKAFGANDRINMGFIGMGGQGRGDMGGFMGFKAVRAVAVCDVVDDHLKLAQKQVNDRYGNQDCKAYRDFRDVIARDDIDAIFIGTPDHWHAVISIAAMKAGKDVKQLTYIFENGVKIYHNESRAGMHGPGWHQRTRNGHRNPAGLPA